MVKKVTTIQTTDNSALVKKMSITQQSMKLKKIPNSDKNITTPEVNKLTAENFAARLKQAKLATKDC